MFIKPLIINRHHTEILKLIQQNSGKPTQHTFLDNYLGNEHPRYPISAPILRKIAEEWMRNHLAMSHTEFSNLLSSLIEGKSSTEKCMVGILLDYSTQEQRKFNPELFDSWLDHLIGWAEVDSVCTGDYTTTEIPANWKKWKSVLPRFSKSENIQKRRASIVVLCSPMRKPNNEDLVTMALANVDRLKSEKEIFIIKTISWVPRNMEKNYRKSLTGYMADKKDTLPFRGLCHRKPLSSLLRSVKTQAGEQVLSLQKFLRAFLFISICDDHYITCSRADVVCKLERCSSVRLSNLRTKAISTTGRFHLFGKQLSTGCICFGLWK